MKCPNCGTVNTNDSIYCTNCEAPLPSKNKRVIFEDFPEYLKESNNSLNTNIGEEKSLKLKKLIFNTIICVSVLILLLTSTVVNENDLENNARDNYIIANDLNGKNYAVIKPDARKELYKKIGFSVSKDRIENRKNKNYVTTYAYYKYYDDITQADSITVYYNDNYSVNYISLNLVYKKEDFNDKDSVIDANNILKNFVNMTVDKSYIDQIINNESYHVKDTKIKAEINYLLIDTPVLEDKISYYVFHIDIERQ